ncbi:DUF4838 domain-containing protein [Chitinophaga rhizophila]|uniref:DUF4838 domain-containing protein n=1 Tax=Chitinophaga rhizophila TaxID=2866212 RepID=A0ABS7G7Y4_9BACT|nr:DUF4838 domain-containing protein [Chitinophaga rhizophila]MBW8683754.1 DUF4838 domain-containing protein [Chitinophaga rhizophila]
MFRMMHGLLLIMTLLTYNSCQPTSGNINLATNGSSSYVIVLPDEATKNETKAAKLLQEYMQRICGASLQIIPEKTYQEQPSIFIGNTEHTNAVAAAPLKGEAFFIASDKRDVYIKGGSGKGVIYGVYTLLEDYFGCRKYADIPVSVPVSKSLQLPQQLMDKQEPAFLYRETYYPAAFDNEYLEWHKLHRFEDLWGVWGHSFFKILPPKTYFSTHPEYYALVNGQRQPSQLCLSSQATFKAVTDYLRTAISDNPDALYWSVAPEDGGGFCTCDECSKVTKEEGGVQGPLIRFINRVAATFPDQQFTTLAYQYTAHPPLKTKPAKNVWIMLSSIDAYRHEPLATIASAAAFRKDLEGWGAITDNLFLWDYTTQFTNYLAPFPDYDNLQPNLQYLKDHKVKGVFSQGSGDTYSDMAAYNSYLQAKLLWNPALTTAEITDEFMNGYYGKAGPFVKQYLQALTTTLHTTKTLLDIYGNPVNNYNNYLSPEAIDQYSSLLDKAEKAVEGNNTLLTRIYNARLPLEYTVLQQSRFFGTEKFGYLVPEGNEYVVNPRWPERVKKFTAQSKAAGVKELSEGGGNADAYQREWETIFARKWISSLAFRAKVALLHPWAEDYPAKKEQTLTDGLQGDKDFSINWLFIYGKDLVATIDMGTAHTVKEVQMNFLQDARHYIFNPTDIIIEISNDGNTFSPAGKQQTTPVAAEEYDARINNFRFSLPALQARYVRVTGRCLQTIPAWRDAAPGKKAAICCDEIYVR